VIKSVRDIDRNENCPECGEFAVRQFVPKRVHFSGTSVQNAEYNPGLGCVVKDKYHRQELCKRKGLVEVGNDFKSGDSMQKHFDSERAAKREKAWEAE
jgi:hypothetical protein